MKILEKPKPLRTINIKPEFSNLGKLPIVENKERREAILQRSLKNFDKIKTR